MRFISSGIEKGRHSKSPGKDFVEVPVAQEHLRRLILTIKLRRSGPTDRLNVELFQPLDFKHME